MFIDEIKIYARAGHGGKGCVAFLRETFRPKGGPSGGNGGRGADVILEADHDLNNLVGQYYQPKLIAPGGEPGMGKGMDGHAGKDLLVKVPCGTLVWKLPMPEVIEPAAMDDEAEAARKPFPTAASKRQVIRHSGSVRAMEISLEDDDEKKSSAPDSRSRE